MSEEDELDESLRLIRDSARGIATPGETRRIRALRFGVMARAAISRAKARASDAAMLVTRQAIQLHGGIGYADEYDTGLYLRRAMVLANGFGGAAPHRARFAALALEEET